MTMKLKMDEDGNAVVRDGKPVYVHADGKEVPFDAPAAMEKISELNAEAAKWRKSLREAEEKLEAYDGLDADEAREAVERLADLDREKLVEAGELEKVKEEVAQGYEKKLADRDSKLEEREREIRQLKVSNRFRSSQALKGTIFEEMPEKAERLFGDSFKIEDGAVVAYSNGSKIYSREKPGEAADFDEALAQLIETDPHSDYLKKGTSATGSGSRSASGPVAEGGQKVVRPDESGMIKADPDEVLSGKVRVEA